MVSLKSAAVGIGAIIAVGYLAIKTQAGKGLSELATGIVQSISSPFVAVGGGLKVMSEGISAMLSPRIAPTIAPTFTWKGWDPFGKREEDRNNGNSGAEAPKPWLNSYGARKEDRYNGAGAR